MFKWMFKGDGENLDILHKCITDEESKYHGKYDMEIVSRDLLKKGEAYKRRKLDESGASFDVQTQPGGHS